MVIYMKKHIQSNLMPFSLRQGVEKCHLRKSLYVLKQSRHAWFGKFNQVIVYRWTISGIMCMLILLSQVVTRPTSCPWINSCTTSLKQKIFGELKNFLGVEMTWSKKGIFLSQRKYVLHLVMETRKIGAKPCSDPMISKLQLMKKWVFWRFWEIPKIGKQIELFDGYSIRYSIYYDHSESVYVIICKWSLGHCRTYFGTGASGCGILYQNHEHMRIEWAIDAD